MQGNILYNARNTDGICPQWTAIAKRTRRQNSSPSVQGMDSKYTVNTLTDNTGHEQLYLLASTVIHNLSGYIQRLRRGIGITVHLFNYHNSSVSGRFRVLCVPLRQQRCKLVLTLVFFYFLLFSLYHVAGQNSVSLNMQTAFYPCHITSSSYNRGSVGCELCNACGLVQVE